uniref:Uncharacterized protein n=1 Tax=Arundo donax TaxID=35708 RepID=A0A0A9H386_ARUDO
MDENFEIIASLATSVELSTTTDEAPVLIV